MRPKCYIPKIEMKFSCQYNYSDDIKKEKLCKKKE